MGASSIDGESGRRLQSTEGEVTGEVESQRSGGAIPLTYIALVDAYGQVVGTSTGSKLNI